MNYKYIKGKYRGLKHFQSSILNLRSSIFDPRFGIFIFLFSFHVIWGCTGNNSGEPAHAQSLKESDNYASVSAQTLEEANENIYSSRRNAITTAVEKVSPAVVGINVTQVREYVGRRPSPFSDPFFDRLFKDFFYVPETRRKVESLGSGFMISKDGYVLTNEHVVHQAVEIIVTMTNGEKHEASIVGIDERTDIALLKLDGDDFSYIDLGNSDDIIIGEWVIALGNPFGLFEFNNKPSVTVGVVSAVDRDFGFTRIENFRRLYQDMIQTDASINGGNSGGPLVNSLGQAIGMNTFIIGSEGSIGLGFAIPINKVKQIVEELKRYGSVDRSWRTGISIQNIDRVLAYALGLNSTNGVVVVNVEKGSPADKAGLEQNDVIIEINGSKIENDDDVYDVFDEQDLRPGDKVAMRIFRRSKEKDIKMTLGKK